MLTLSALYIYPVKSLSGVALQQSTITSQGLLGDRLWMIVDPNNRFVTQRKLPALATIKTTLNFHDKTLALTLSKPGMHEIALKSHEGNESPSINVRVWNDICDGVEAPKEINDWITEAVKSKLPLRLVQFATRFKRSAQIERFGSNHTHFADAAPFLVANEASLSALNDKLTKNDLPLAEMRQFRPNLVFSGMPAFSEHNYKLVKSHKDNVSLKLHDHCQRCAIITINQETGEPLGKQSPLKTLSHLNSMPNNSKAPAFGVNSTLSEGNEKTICVGNKWSAVRDEKE